MGEDKPSDGIKDSTLFGAIRNLDEITTKIYIKTLGKETTESKEALASEDSITRARNRIISSVDKLRKVDRALSKLDRK